MGRIQGRVAIVNGASRGIGAAIARAYAREGAAVAVVACTAEPGGRFPGTIIEVTEGIRREGGEALAIQCDSTQEHQVEATVNQVLAAYGRIDVVVNNLGVMLLGPVVETLPRHWLLALRVNLYAPFLMCHYALPAMIERRTGSIINVTSGAAESVRGASYASTKAGLNRFTICLAEELRPHNIAVNALDPGPVRTEAAEILQPADHDWTDYVPPEAVGPLAVYLALQDGNGVSGQVLRREEFREKPAGR